VGVGGKTQLTLRERKGETSAISLKKQEGQREGRGGGSRQGELRIYTKQIKTKQRGGVVPKKS